MNIIKKYLNKPIQISDKLKKIARDNDDDESPLDMYNQEEFEEYQQMYDD